MKLLHHITILLVALALSSGVFGQDVVVKGALKDYTTLKKLEVCQVVVFRNGQQYDVYDAGGSGKYELRLELGYNYDLKFAKDGYVAKTVRVDTRNIPEEDKAGGFQMDLPGMLFAMVDGFNTDILKEPVAKAQFNPETNSIEFDADYTERMKDKIDAEFKRLENLKDGQDKMKAEYDKFMQEGEQKMIEKKYKDAMGKFSEALKLFPQDAPAKQKYDAAKAAYDAELAAAADNAKYQKLIDEGQAAINGRKWDEAKKKYNDAKALKPAEKLPKEKLYEIDQLMANAEKQDEYDKLMADGNSLFANKDYALSIEKYKAASLLFPTISEPKDQIAKAQAALDALLADEAKRKQLEQRFNDLMALGDKNKGEDKLESALTNFKEASNMKPDEALPKTKIKEIEDLIAQRENDRKRADADALANKEKEEIERLYNDLIQQADRLYTDKKWLDSKGKYQDALAVKEASYPHARITSIDEILAAEEAKKNNDALADKAAKDAEAARLNEEERLAELARKEKDAEEARLRRQREIEEEEARARAALAEKKPSSGFLNEADRAREDEVERYYRQSRAWQDSLKYADVRNQAEINQKFHENRDNRTSDRIKEQEALIAKKKEEEQNINDKGKSFANRNASDNERKKEEEESNQKDFADRASYRNEQSQEKIEEVKEADASLAGNDRHREKLVAQVEQKQETYKENDESYATRNGTMRTDASMKFEKQKKDQVDATYDGEAVRQQNQDELEEKKKEYDTNTTDAQGAARVRIEGTSTTLNAQKQSAESISSEGNRNNTAEEMNAIQEKKSQVEGMAIDKEAKAAEARYQTRKALFDVDAGQQQTDKPAPGTEDVPEGVSETSYELNNKMITERTVKRGTKVDKYLKSVSKTGIYYFKNGKPITKQMWIQETLENEQN
jgi:epidermal growth factor receptor substrate 15